MELTLENISEQDTARIGKSMAPLLFPGAFIALFGDLGYAWDLDDNGHAWSAKLGMRFNW